ncbi:hypothetical protein [Streptomyces sp. NBC_00464]|uniref:hypothetical protein n=1 Tax=Streptomyces sp. NBC_00464 TaxID=2975751 RepID=UPI003FA734BA
MKHLLDLIAPDVALLTDGGGVVRAAQVNGNPTLILRTGGEIDSVLAVRLEGGLITGLYAVRNPEKLSRVDRETALGR